MVSNLLMSNVLVFNLTVSSLTISSLTVSNLVLWAVHQWTVLYTSPPWYANTVDTFLVRLAPLWFVNAD